MIEEFQLGGCRRQLDNLIRSREDGEEEDRIRDRTAPFNPGPDREVSGIGVVSFTRVLALVEGVGIELVELGIPEQFWRRIQRLWKI